MSRWSHTSACPQRLYFGSRDCCVGRLFQHCIAEGSLGGSAALVGDVCHSSVEIEVTQYDSLEAGDVSEVTLLRRPGIPLFCFVFQSCKTLAL